jgi:hypothetical protein
MTGTEVAEERLCADERSSRPRDEAGDEIGWGEIEIELANHAIREPLCCDLAALEPANGVAGNPAVPYLLSIRRSWYQPGQFVETGKFDQHPTQVEEQHIKRNVVDHWTIVTNQGAG